MVILHLLFRNPDIFLCRDLNVTFLYPCNSDYDKPVWFYLKNNKFQKVSQ